MQCTVHFIITLFNVGNVLLCVNYQLNFAVFVYTMLHEYHVNSIRYYPQFHVTAVGLGTYYPRIRWHYCTLLVRSLLWDTLPPPSMMIRVIDRTSQFCFVMCVPFCVFCVLFVCKYVRYCCHRVSTQLQLKVNKYICVCVCLCVYSASSCNSKFSQLCWAAADGTPALCIATKELIRLVKSIYGAKLKLITALL
jgi:hypothetical protein